MRFPKKIVRYLGAGLSPLLGSDADPTTLTPAQQAAYKGKDNVLTARGNNINGFPVQRVAAGYVFDGVGAPGNMPVSVFVFDDNTGRWFKIANAALAIPLNTIVFLDVCTLLDFPNTREGEGMQSTGALEIAIVPQAPAGAPDGTYSIVLGCDVSNPGV